MWIVSIALRRPYTFLMMALLIVLMGIYSILRTATDIFPNINIPITAVVWQYNGLQPEEIANRVVLFSERVAQTIVNDIEHTESQSVSGTAVVKYFFQPSAKEELAFSQITGASQTLLRFAPPGTTPPLILAYNASTVPILQLALSSDSLPESQIYDLGNNVLRTALATIPGAAVPFPYGGKQRQVQVDLDLKAMRARGLSGNDVIAAIGAGNLVLPAGTQKIGESEYFIKLNSSPKEIDELNNLPIRAHDGTVIYIRDVAHVHDGNAPQTNMVRLDGRRAVLMNVLKTGNASTLDIINAVNAKLPQIRASLPPELKIEALSDQSIFVRSAITGVVREAVIAGALTGALILLFLGSWRSTLIITVSIPLSILASIVCLAALGETINIMTLGGLALAVGILVDDATVTIENINWHLEQGKGVQESILDGAAQIALPALVSTLAICIVFVPMFLLAGIAKYLFIPMAEAVVFAMLASYVLSRTLVPTLAMYWLKPHDAHAHANPTGVLHRFQRGFERKFEAMREGYKSILEWALDHGKPFAIVFLAAMTATALLAFPIGPLPGLGQDFFPAANAGQLKLHIRARSGTRIEETAALCDAIETTIRGAVPAGEITNVVDNLGLPYSGINLAYSSSAPVGPADADIFINLNEEHTPTAELMHILRGKLNAQFPSVAFSFLPADIVGQILNFGLPSPLDIQITGFNVAANRAFANVLLQKLHAVPGAVDLRIQQASDYPQINVNVDRSKAQLLGLSEQNVASNLLVSLSGSFQTSPSFWNDPKTGTQYSVVAQTPQHQLQTLNDLQNTPLTTAANAPSQVLSNVAGLKRSTAPTVVSHFNAVPAIDIYGTVEGADLGYVAKHVSEIVEAARKDLPKGSNVVVRGQVETMHASFNGLLIGLAGAIVLVYMLIVVNFQSLLDPLIIISALPAALAGIVWMLFLTHTSVSVPALTGAIMCMGVATANSVLVVSFARERLEAGDSAYQAALQAGFGRLRPVMMTALAMIIGMIPMALGLGDGGEQNAPLGRAVIGGLIFATIATLFFVPVIFSIVRGRKAAPAHPSLEVSHV
ncbi:efflux RND transporter permease subunit [Rugamonas sp.]|uniref:efflux RND transporter permease subunit n=1 Tax=Rugamonas sp. TaxID=1926287 RepID=UPI0025DFD618|nr:efflux RND transporter permease subunit [Rugamonas sp.]